jgi:two-component system, chemotaxis family, protein-glutamate methylesterase/glutaminase
VVDGRKVRVLVVEDSATVRDKLCRVLSADPDIELVGAAADGQRAIEMTRELRPDLITLDMILPVLNGLEVTEYVMAYLPTPILVVSSSLNRGELHTTYDALAAGAVDVLEKPTGSEPEGVWEDRLLSTVKLVSRIRVISHPRGRLRAIGQARAAAVGVPPVRPTAAGPYDVVAIGASTGGPGAIVEVLRSLPAEYALPVLVVVHIAEPFGTAFADWLDEQTPHRVRYAVDGQAVSTVVGGVVLAPPNLHLRVSGGRLRLTTDHERHSCRPSVDVLFESVADEYGPRAAGFLLTGMGRDGAAGLLAMRRAGGLTVAQDEATSVVYGMPKEAADIGAAQSVLPLDAIAALVAALPARRENGVRS